MVKRIVVLQDEQLVVREMTRAGRPVAAFAGAGAGVGAFARPGSHAVADEPEEAETESGDPAEALENGDAPQESATPPGSRLADVAKAAALKAERAIIEDTLRQVHWNRRRAAERLGVSYKTLLNKIKECGISRK